MLEGPFSRDKKFIRFCNEAVVHFMYLQGEKKETITVKAGGEEEVRSRYVPQLKPETIDEIGKDMMTWLRDPKAAKEWRCPRVEIWSAGRKLLHEYGPGSRFIPAQLIVKAIKEAQKKLGPGMPRKLYLKAAADLEQAESAIVKGDHAEAKKRLDKLERMKGLTPAFKQEIQDRRKDMVEDS